MKLNRRVGILLSGLAAILVFDEAMRIYRSTAGESGPGVIAVATWRPNDTAAPVCLASVPQAAVACSYAAWQTSYYPTHLSWQGLFQGAHR